MQIVSRWYDEDHRVIYVYYKAGWTWEELARIKQDLEVMMASVTWEVHIISDLRGASLLPNGSALAHLQQILSTMPDNLGLLATLGGNPVLQTLSAALQKVTLSSAARKIRYFSTLEEIHICLEQNLQQKLKVSDDDLTLDSRI
jgi:hypothetical protein